MRCLTEQAQTPLLGIEVRQGTFRHDRRSDGRQGWIRQPCRRAVAARGFLPPAMQAIATLDVPMIMGTVLFAATAIVAVNLAVDLLYPLLDPRMR